MYILVVGHSHIDFIKNQYNLERGRGFFPSIDMEFLELRFCTPYEQYVTLPEVMGAELDEAIFEVIAKRGEAPVALFLSVGGSDQHTIAMLNHHRVMDVVVPWACDLPVQDGATLIPFRMMEQLLLIEVSWKLNLLRLIHERLGVASYFWQAPPPIGSEEHLQRHPGPQFQELAGSCGFSPLVFRLKVAAIHDELFKSLCVELGVHYLLAPAAALEPNGSLRVDFCTEDSIHAGLAYGALLLAEACSIAEDIAGRVA